MLRIRAEPRSLPARWRRLPFSSFIAPTSVFWPAASRSPGTGDARYDLVVLRRTMSATSRHSLDASVGVRFTGRTTLSFPRPEVDCAV